MNTTPESRADIYARMIDGEPLSSQEVEELLEDASSGDQASEILEALTHALGRMGYIWRDVTTDDDERIEVLVAKDLSRGER